MKICLRGFRPGKLKPACAATEASQRHGILDIETRDSILSRQRITKVLIRLRGSVPLLFPYGKSGFSHDMAQIESICSFTEDSKSQPSKPPMEWEKRTIMDVGLYSWDFPFFK